MKIDSQSLWNKFKHSLIESIKETEVIAFKAAWKSCSDRTKFYFGELLPKVAKKLDLGFHKEKPFRIDGIFVKKGGQTTDVPLIYLESENIAASSHEEVYKLCCLNAPLKVLIVCTEWDDEFWKKQIIDGHWHYIVEDFKDELSLTGSFAFIIAAWDETLKFHAYVLDEHAEITEDTLLIEIEPT
jgi:hypothetical protein